MDLEDLIFSFEAEDDKAAVRRAVELLAALTGVLPEIESIDEEDKIAWLRNPRVNPSRS